MLLKNRYFIPSLTILFCLLLFGFVYQSYNRFNDLSSKIDSLSSQVVSIKSLLTYQSLGELTDEDTDLGEDGNDDEVEKVIPMKGRKEFIFSKSDDIQVVANTLAKGLDFPIIFPKGAISDGSDFIYEYLDYGKVGDFNDYDYLFLGGEILVNDVEVRVYIASLPEGPLCDDFYSFKTNLGNLSNCVVVQDDDIFNDISFKYPLKNNQYNENMSYRYVLKGKYSEVQVKELLGNLVVFEK